MSDEQKHCLFCHGEGVKSDFDLPDEQGKYFDMSDADYCSLEVNGSAKEIIACSFEGSITLRINFCPICGRFLEEK